MPVRIPRNPHNIMIISDQNLGHRPIPTKDQNAIIEKIMVKLKEADSNNDDCYDWDELKHALKDLGAILPGWRTGRCFEVVDTNNDGHISGDEINKLVNYLRARGYGK